MSTRHTKLTYTCALLLALSACGITDDGQEPFDDLARKTDHPCPQAVACEGNHSLKTQAEVNALADCGSLSGSLKVSGADIQDLSPLACIATIGDYLAVSDNPALTSVVDGFAALKEVGGGIFFYNNHALEQFDGFHKLQQTGDNIDFWYHDALVSVEGFGSLQTAGWSLEFGGNPLLTRLPRFAALTQIMSSLFILDNASLTTIDGFQALQYVDWSFAIQGNTSLDSVCGMYNYFSLNNPYTGGGTYEISDNGPALPSPTTMQDVIDVGRCMLDPVAAVQNLRALVVALQLSKRPENRMTRALDGALEALECGIACVGEAIADLETFKTLCNRQRDGKLTGPQADHLIAEADAIIAALAS